jgi:hypothetical protein
MMAAMIVAALLLLPLAIVVTPAAAALGGRPIVAIGAAEAAAGFPAATEVVDGRGN